jgi:iron complex outermembrane receptor protein
MMSKMLALATVSALAMTSGAAAQSTGAASATSADTSAQTSLEEVVVTARRKSENLQEVPQVVSVVSADTLQKLNIQQFTDVAAVTPGLTLTSGSTGYDNSASMRGVTFDTVSNASSTVAFYVNDAPVESTFVFQGLFDIGQIEVLRGPQGTVRGVSAPSGAITLTTRKPDLYDYGGYVDATLTDRDGRNVQGAVNIPILQDKLAVRVAGLSDRNDAGGVRSLHNTTDPKATTQALRGSVLFTPTQDLTAELVYQTLSHKSTSFSQVSGPGAGYNGPSLTSSDRLAVQDGLNEVDQDNEGLIGRLDYDALGHRLSYVGSYQNVKLTPRAPDDLGNNLPGGEIYSTVRSRQTRTSHEIRLSSTTAPGRMFDYTVGAYGELVRAKGQVEQVASQLPGAFGSPLLAPDPTAYNGKYALPLFIDAPTKTTQLAVFGSVTAHLGSKTELTAGVRHFVAKGSNSIAISAGSALIALPPSALGLPSCAAAGLAVTYADTCDVPTAMIGIAPGVLRANAQQTKFTPTIYNVSLSHRLNRDLMVYANTGSSWRAGGVELIGPNNAGNDPNLAEQIYHDPEHSRSYEAGVKWTFLEGRGRFNAAIYHQTFKDLRFRTQPLPYYDDNGLGSVNITILNFTTTADAVVDGFDLEAAFQITPKWNLSLSGSYADGRIDNDLVPCRDGNFDGIADNLTPTAADFLAAGTALAVCKSGSSITQNPYWNLSLRTEYVTPLRGKVDGFVRALLPYNPSNDRQTIAQTIGAYGILNLYAGVRSQDGAWEASLFAKNALKTDETLNRNFAEKNVGGLPGQFGASGYYQTTTTPRREIGVNIRYAFGSR